jgi:hypothetical protein
MKPSSFGPHGLRFNGHPKGGECRLTIDGEWHRGSVAVDGRTLLDLAFDWRDSFVAKGWGPVMGSTVKGAGK